MPDVWDPVQYALFREERRQPFRDLLGLLRAPWSTAPCQAESTPAVLRAIDLGCGDGQLTSELQDYLVEQSATGIDLLGIDNSLKMIEACRGHANPLAVSTAPSPDFRRVPASVPSPRFALGDILRFSEKAVMGELAPYDIVFSNAAIHWVPDHPRLLLGLIEALAPGGQLAVQLPANHDHPSQTIARELAAREPYLSALEGYGTEPPGTVLPPEQYAELLQRYGCAEQHVRLQVYTHLLADSSSVVAWVRGTLLTAFQQRLSPELWEQFLADYREELATRIGSRRPYLLTYKRILFWGRKAA